jgi:hypothetical protein
LVRTPQSAFLIFSPEQSLAIGVTQSKPAGDKQAMKTVASPSVLKQATQPQMEPKVAALPEDEPKVGKDLPNPALNPMLNPLLGKNLGRWAHVYYTTPPEERDRAVLALLRELENAQTPRRERKPFALDEKNSKNAQPKTLLEALTCSVCLHENAAHQRFCGLCGFALEADKTSDPEQQVLPRPMPSPIKRKTEDWPAAREKDVASSGVPPAKSRSWKCAAFLIIIFTAISSYWLGRMRSQTPSPINRGEARPKSGSFSLAAAPAANKMPTAAANPKQVIERLRPNAASGESKTGNMVPAVRAPDSAKRIAKPPAGTPIGCREDHLENCSVGELYRRTMILADTIDALFIDYDKQVMRLLKDARAHQGDSGQKQQERSRQGNHSAQLWERLRLSLYMSNNEKDALKYRTELLRRTVKPGLDNRGFLGTYKNPQLCLELHYVAEDLRRLAAQLAEPVIPNQQSTLRLKSNSLSR